MVKIVNSSGKRKTAIARATLKPGNGRIRINSVPLEIYGTEVIRMKIAEPLLLVPDALDGVDAAIEVSGGGRMGQAEAVRTAVINKRAGGMGLISGRKAFQRPMPEGVELLNAIQDVYLDDSVTVA